MARNEIAPQRSLQEMLLATADEVDEDLVDVTTNHLRLRKSLQENLHPPPLPLFGPTHACHGTSHSLRGLEPGLGTHFFAGVAKGVAPSGPRCAGTLCWEHYYKGSNGRTPPSWNG